MKSRDFCYWLQGLFEVGELTELNAKQVATIRQHLNMVFIHEIDPSFPVDQQQALDEAHKPRQQTGWSSDIHNFDEDDFFPEPEMKC